jgi:oligosaccharide repeat unit polymerase
MVLIGLALLFLGVAMLVIHLTSGKGLIVDPVSISWLGYLMYIPMSISLAAVGQSEYPGVRNYVLLMYVVATLFYIIGLYSGKGNIVAKLLPKPPERLSVIQLWMIILASGLLFGIFWSGGRYVPSALANVVLGINLASVGAMVLLGFYAIICYQGRYLTKLLTGILSVAMLILMLQTIWSRRPVFAVLFSAVCLFYYKKLLWRPARIRFFFWITAGVLGVIFLFYLNATRTERYLGVQSATSQGIFSAANIEDFSGGISVGHFVFEKVVDAYQKENEFGFQYGKTYIPGLLFWIPRSIWPSKPNTGGGIATVIWANTVDFASNVSPTPIGEAYINFGFLGVIIVPFIAGWFVRGLNTYMISNQTNEVLWLAWFAVIPDFATQWRGDFCSMFVQSFMRVSLILLISWMTKRFGREYNTISEPDLGESHEEVSDYK